MNAPFTISEAVGAYQQAWDWLPTICKDARFMSHLSQLRLVNYDNGSFTFEVPNAETLALMNRRAESGLIRQAIEAYMPASITVRVEFVLSEWAVTS